MNEVKADQHYYDREILVDQCENCGGLWFDKDEFYKVKIGEATELEKINLKKLEELSMIKSEVMSCPKDGRALRPYADIYANKKLKGLQLFSCDECAGFWFNRGEFTKYQGSVAAEELKNDNLPSVAVSIASLEDYREELKKIQALKPVGARAVMTYGAVNDGSGNWGWDILLDIISLILSFRKK